MNPRREAELRDRVARARIAESERNKPDLSHLNPPRTGRPSPQAGKRQRHVPVLNRDGINHCHYCGAPTVGRIVCPEHRDLVGLDAPYWKGT